MWICVCRLATQEMGAVLICWRQQVQRRQRNDRLVAQRVQHAKSALLFAVVSQWRQVAAIQQGKATIIAKCQRRHASNLLQQGFIAFSTALVVRKTRRSIVQVVSSKAKVSYANIFWQHAAYLDTAHSCSTTCNIAYFQQF